MAVNLCTRLSLFSPLGQRSCQQRPVWALRVIAWVVVNLLPCLWMTKSNHTKVLVAVCLCWYGSRPLQTCHAVGFFHRSNADVQKYITAHKKNKIKNKHRCHRAEKHFQSKITNMTSKTLNEEKGSFLSKRTFLTFVIHVIPSKPVVPNLFGLCPLKKIAYLRVPLTTWRLFFQVWRMGTFSFYIASYLVTLVAKQNKK